MAIIGTINAFVQADNGDVFLGTNDAARIYRSTNNGQTWTQVVSFGSSSSVTGLTKNLNGYLFASVILGAASQGIWRSTDHGATWTRVKTNPASANGYADIAVIQRHNYIVAVGYGSSSADGNFVSSNNGGNTWFNGFVGLNHRALLAHRVATSERGTIAWFGFDDIAPMPVLTNPGEGALSTQRNTVPFSGTDIAVFNYVNSSNLISEARMWAVQNGVNTEIYKYATDHMENLGAYTTGWAKVATIANEEFFTLYVDPNPWYLSYNRTLLAGANGKIFVSYNNGLAWAVATEAPVGKIHALIRTAAGVLIAGGENGEVFLFSGGSTGGSGSEGGGTTTPPITPPTTPPTTPIDPDFVPIAQLLGREATCDDEVYASNKTSFSNVTHIVRYSGSYEELQFATALPYYLLDETPAVGNILYFGSKTTDANVPGGTFSSLIFDITQEARDITLAWEYWNGSAWSTLTKQDNTSSFQEAGVRSVHWAIPTNWATTSVNSVTGYWVRVRVTAIGSDVVAPIHDNRYIYTVNLPFVEIAEEEVSGELPALMKVKWNNRADDLSTNLALHLDRLVCGLRSVSRGQNFNAYLNISDVQPNFGITISKDTDGSWSTDLKAPTLRALTVSHASGARLNAWNNLITFTFSNTVARDYYGQYRAFLRCYKIGSGSNNWQIRLRTIFGSGGGKVDNRAVFPNTATDWEVLDLGQISIPSIQTSNLSENIGDQMSIIVQGYNTTTGIAIRFYDLILIPHDEWAVDALMPELSTAATSDIKGSYAMDIDSISNPKVSLSTLNRNAANQIVSRYQAISNGPAILQRNTTQRLWFLGMSFENYWRGYPEIAGSIQVFKQQRYLGFRGDH